MLAVWALLLVPATRDAMLAQLQKNHSIELATFVVFLAGGVFALALAMRHLRAGTARWLAGFHLLAGLGLIGLAGEEVAWGQWFFGWKTPEWWDHFNKQDETTFHNIGPLQGRTEWLRLAFGLAGLAGIALRTMGWLREIMPAKRLLPWLLAIVVFTLPDLYNDYFPFTGWIQNAANHTSEAVELLIAVTAFLYLRDQASAYNRGRGA